jgi:hypothetical protein
MRTPRRSYGTRSGATSAATSAREPTPSFEKIEAIWFSTVRSLIVSVLAIARFEFPDATSTTTSRSRSASSFFVRPRDSARRGQPRVAGSRLDPRCCDRARAPRVAAAQARARALATAACESGRRPVPRVQHVREPRSHRSRATRRRARDTPYPSDCPDVPPNARAERVLGDDLRASRTGLARG